MIMSDDHDIEPKNLPGSIKVHIFSEVHKILWNLHCRFERYYIEQIYSGNFAKIYGLLRIYELYQIFFLLLNVW